MRLKDFANSLPHTINFPKTLFFGNQLHGRLTRAAAIEFDDLFEDNSKGNPWMIS